MKFNRLLSVAMLLLIAGCGGSQKKEDRGFHTSGNREADQRAEQRMAKDEQTSGKGAGNDADANKKKTLYERLGAEEGLTAIVNDFVDRAMADPRVNWERKGVRQGGFSLKRTKSVEWKPTEESIKNMKTHIVQFLSVATGGPSKYDGREMKDVHANMHVSNAEFDASVGDMKATLDKLAIPTPEQKELLAILESARPQIVEER